METLIKIIYTCSFSIGVYLAMISLLILDLEIQCGIENMPTSAGIKILIMFVAGVALILTGVKMYINTDSEY